MLTADEHDFDEHDEPEKDEQGDIRTHGDERRENSSEFRFYSNQDTRGRPAGTAP